MRRAARTDHNHAETVRAFRQHGMAVRDMSGVGKDFPDLMVAWGRVSVLVEVKDGAKPPSRRKRSEGQEQFAALWPGRVFLCESLDDVADIVAAIRRDARFLRDGTFQEGRL